MRRCARYRWAVRPSGLRTMLRCAIARTAADLWTRRWIGFRSMTCWLGCRCASSVRCAAGSIMRTQMTGTDRTPHSDAGSQHRGAGLQNGWGGDDCRAVRRGSRAPVTLLTNCSRWSEENCRIFRSYNPCGELDSLQHIESGAPSNRVMSPALAHEADSNSPARQSNRYVRRSWFRTSTKRMIIPTNPRTISSAMPSHLLPGWVEAGNTAVTYHQVIACREHCPPPTELEVGGEAGPHPGLVVSWLTQDT
jgi:hypothetical protein